MYVCRYIYHMHEVRFAYRCTIFINYIAIILRTGYTPVHILIILYVSFFGADRELYSWPDQFLAARAASAIV